MSFHTNPTVPAFIIHAELNMRGYIHLCYKICLHLLFQTCNYFLYLDVCCGCYYGCAIMMSYDRINKRKPCDRIWGLTLNSLRLGDAYTVSVNWALISSDRGLFPVVPSHHLNQCKFIVNWALRNKVKCQSKYNNFHVKKWVWKCHLQNGSHFV